MRCFRSIRLWLFVTSLLQLDLVLVNLQRSQRYQRDLLSFMIKGMSVCVAIMHDSLIKLPWSSQKDVACVHGKDIAKDLVLISTNGKRNCELLLHILFTSFVQPFQPERSRKWFGLKPKFPDKSVSSNVSTTTTINNNRTNFVGNQI